MSDLKNSRNFIFADKIPTFHASVPALDVYRELAKTGRGAFVITGDKQQSFVNAAQLAETTILKAGLPRSRKTKDATIGLLCDLPDAQTAVMPIEADPVSDVLDPQKLRANGPDKVFRVLHEDAEIGYFLNREGSVDPATRPVVYVCSNGHRNADPDHGYCYSCPARVQPE